MREIDLQTDIVKAIQAKGGFARKLSHRFAVGVADLLIKIPKLPAMVLEVKLNDKPVRIPHIILDVTKPQYRFLRDARAGGMVAGVMSLVGDDRRNLRAYILHVDELPALIDSDGRMRFPVDKGEPTNLKLHGLRPILDFVLRCKAMGVVEDVN